MNSLINQTLDLMQGMAALPFKTVENALSTEDSIAAKAITQSVKLTEGMVMMPFKMAKDFFQPNSGASSPDAAGEQ